VARTRSCCAGGHGAAETDRCGPLHGAHSGSRDYNFDPVRGEFTDPRKYLASTAENTTSQLHGLYHDEGPQAVRRSRRKCPKARRCRKCRRLLQVPARGDDQGRCAIPGEADPRPPQASQWLISRTRAFFPLVEEPSGTLASNATIRNSTISTCGSLGRYAPARSPRRSRSSTKVPKHSRATTRSSSRISSNMIAVHKGNAPRTPGRGQGQNSDPGEQYIHIHRGLHKYIYGAGE